MAVDLKHVIREGLGVPVYEDAWEPMHEHMVIARAVAEACYRDAAEFAQGCVGPYNHPHFFERSGLEACETIRDHFNAKADALRGGKEAKP